MKGVFVCPIFCSSPPTAVQTVLTAVAIMLGHQEPTWSEVRRVRARRPSRLLFRSFSLCRQTDFREGYCHAAGQNLICVCMYDTVFSICFGAPVRFGHIHECLVSSNTYVLEVHMTSAIPEIKPSRHGRPFALAHWQLVFQQCRVSLCRVRCDHPACVTQAPQRLTGATYIFRLFLNAYLYTFRVPQVISKADFIATVVNFDTDSLTSAVIKTVEDVFKAAGDLTADAVTRASKACGPLYNVGCSLASCARYSASSAPLPFSQR